MADKGTTKKKEPRLVVPAKAPKKSDPRLAALTKLSSSVTLVDVTLLESHAKLILPFIDAEAPGKADLKFKADGKVIGEYLHVRIEFVMHGFREGQRPDAEEGFVVVKVCYLLKYKLMTDTPPDDTLAKLFAFMNGAYNAWPFFREHAHSMTAKMGLPPFVAPSFKPRLPPLG